MKTSKYTLTGGKTLLYPVQGQISGLHSKQLRSEVYGLARSLAATQLSFCITNTPISL
jgi:hypothetical protein